MLGGAYVGLGDFGARANRDGAWVEVKVDNIDFRLGHRLGRRAARGVFLPVAEGAQLRKQYVVRRPVLRVRLEDRALEILDGVGLAVEVAPLLKLLGDGIALLGQAAVGIPIGQELALHVLAGLRKEARP